LTRVDPQRCFLRAVARELRWRPLTRRRLLRELDEHLNDSVAHLQAAGLSPDQALREALARLGEVEAIVSSVRSASLAGRWRRSVRRLRSPAWVAVGAMSLVTAWAAELPPASGAKTTASAAGGAVQHSPSLTHRHSLGPGSDRGPGRRTSRTRS
jgi:hypothetical protein